MKVSEFVEWFWKYVLGIRGPSFRNPKYRKLLGQAKYLTDNGYDLGKVMETIEAMSKSGIAIYSPFCIKMEAPNGMEWYEYATSGISHPWDSLSPKLSEQGIMTPRIS